jgi:AraC-like DNA-binding protein
MSHEKTSQELLPDFDNPVLVKLDAMARQHLGGRLHVLLCEGNQVKRLCLDGVEADLPAFCKLVRATEEGLRRCSVCRWLVAIRACHHNVTDYSCHGGISVVAAAAVIPDNTSNQFVVVSSCGFGDEDREKGWQAARRHAEGLPIRVHALREAYFQLPVLDSQKITLAKDLVDAAAEALRIRAPRPKSSGSDREGSDTLAPETSLQKMLSQAFEHAVERQPGESGRPTGSPLVDVVMAVVKRNPALPFTVTDVAHSARLTPNHFSALFKKHTGETFSDFLSAQRAALARHYLADLHLSVSEVAARAGFSDPAYFSRRFKALTGFSPSDYRAALLSK